MVLRSLVQDICISDVRLEYVDLTRWGGNRAALLASTSTLVLVRVRTPYAAYTPSSIGSLNVLSFVGTSTISSKVNKSYGQALRFRDLTKRS